MTNTWFVMIPPSYTGKSDAEKELVDFRISYPAGSQAWNDANAGRIVQGSEGDSGNPQVSEQLVKWKGPYATEADAQAAQNPQQQSANPVNDLVNAGQNSNNPIANLLTGNFSGLVAHWPGADTFLSRALKIVVGGVLLLAGIIKMSGAGKEIPVVAAAAMKVPGV